MNYYKIRSKSQRLYIRTAQQIMC